MRGDSLRMLTVLDEHTREYHMLLVDRALKTADVIAWVKTAIEQHGAPEFIRSDNGSEFIAKELQRWLAEQDIKTIYIEPASPWENGFIEGLHDKLRDECLNRELFGRLLEARVILETWRIEYNESRPHSSLRYLTPGEFVRRSNSGLWTPVALRAPCVQSCYQHQNQPQPTTSRTSDLICPTYGVRPGGLASISTW